MSDAPLEYNRVHPGKGFRTWNRPALAVIVVAALYGGYQIKDYLDSRSQYMMVANGIRLYSSAIAMVLHEYWASNGSFPPSNVAAGLPDDDGGAWPGFRRVALTSDGRTVFEYARAEDGSGPDPFVFVIADHPGEGFSSWLHVCGGSGLRPRVKEWLSHFCAWDSSINSYAPAQDATLALTSQSRPAAPLQAEVSEEERAALLARYDLGLTPLMHAANRGDVPEVRRLLQTPGTQINALDKEGGSALMYACRSRTPELVELLLAAGASAQAPSNDGATALLWALKTPPTAAPGLPQAPQPSAESLLLIAEKLLAKGLDLNAPDKKGNVALHRAADLGDAALAQWLLAHGASLEVRDHLGRTPLMRAALAPTADAVLQLLIQHGANLNARDTGNRTVLQLALSRVGPDTERRYLMLRNAGAR